MMKKIIKSLKYIKLKDITAPFLFLVALFPALLLKVVFKIEKKELWLICEDGKTARDNGYYFYKYLRETHPEINSRYVISDKSCDYEKIAKFKNKPINAFSLKHYIFYLAAKWNISNHKSGNPNQPFFYIIHVVLKMINNRIFLQHGITKDDSPWIYYKNTNFKLFICGAKREYEFVKERFGYPEKAVVYTGFSRFDTLIDQSKNEKQILVMPTWRNWLNKETNSLVKKSAFKDSNYFKKWNSLLGSKDFIDYIENNKINVLFYPHQNVQKNISDFEIKSKNIKICQMDVDIQKILKESNLLVTDYSSVYMDFAYMNKAVLYYHFDYDEYRRGHLQEGYFDYEEHGFGPIFDNPEGFIGAIHSLCKNTKKYEGRRLDFFEKRDTYNNERIFKSIMAIER